MKKLLPIGLGVVALGLLAAPKFIGNQFEQKFNKITQSINDQPGYQIEILEYDQSWFGTSAKLALVIGLDTLTQGQMPGEELRIPLELNANPGPILLSDNASFGLVQWQLSAAAEALREHLTWPSDQAFYQMDASLGFGSQLDYQDRPRPHRRHLRRQYCQ